MIICPYADSWLDTASADITKITGIATNLLFTTRPPKNFFSDALRSWMEPLNAQGLWYRLNLFCALLRNIPHLSTRLPSNRNNVTCHRRLMQVIQVTGTAIVSLLIPIKGFVFAFLGANFGLAFAGRARSAVPHKDCSDLAWRLTDDRLSLAHSRDVAARSLNARRELHSRLSA